MVYLGILSWRMESEISLERQTIFKLYWLSIHDFWVYVINQALTYYSEHCYNIEAFGVIVYIKINYDIEDQ